MQEHNSARGAEVHQMALDKEVKEAEKKSKTKFGKRKANPEKPLIDVVKDGVGKAATLHILKEAAKVKLKKK